MAFLQADVNLFRQHKDSEGNDTRWVIGVTLHDDTLEETAYREYEVLGEQLQAIVDIPNDAGRKAALLAQLRPLIVSDHAAWEEAIPNRPSRVDLSQEEVDVLLGVSIV